MRSIKNKERVDITGEIVYANITRERKCSSFMALHQGATPMDHREMRDHQEDRKWGRIEVLILFLGVLAAILLPLLISGKSEFNPTINVKVPSQPASQSETRSNGQ